MSGAILSSRAGGRRGAWPDLPAWYAALLHLAIPRPGVVARALGRWREDAPRAEGAPSFEALALPHLDGAYTLARYLCRDADAAEDIVQDAFLRAYRGWSDFRGGSVRAWLFAIVRNCHLTWQEQRRRHPRSATTTMSGHDEETEDPLAAVPAAGDPETALLQSDAAACVRRVLGSLPDDMREVLVLRDLEDCSYREIADILGLPMGTVMSRLSRARRAFAKAWTRDIEETSDG